MMCEKCLYKANCQFLAKHKHCKVEGCTAFRNEKELVADTVRKMQERLKGAFNFGHTILEKSICDIIDQIANELFDGEGL